MKTSPVIAVSETTYSPIINTLEEGLGWGVGVATGCMALLAVAFIVGYVIRRF